MNRPGIRKKYFLLATLVGVICAAPLHAAPAGSEFRINTTTVGSQRTTFDSVPAVAIDGAGNFVAVWASEGQDSGVTWGVYGQRYNAAGVPQGGEFRVNTTVAGNQLEPSVAMDGTGNFVVSWTGVDASDMGVFFQRYNAAGTPQGSETQANTYTTSDQKWSGTAMDAVGNFVVIWASFGQDGSRTGVYGQRFNATGIAQGGELHISTQTLYEQDSPVVSMNASGAFVVCWSSWAQDSGNSWGSYAQRFNAAGTPQGSEFRTSTTTASEQWYNRVAIDDIGNFIVVWESQRQDSPNNGGVYFQQYYADGTTLGTETQANTYTTGDQWETGVATTPTGEFVITWGSDGQDGSNGGIYGQQYLADGTPDGGEFQIHTTTSGMQERPSAAQLTDEEFVVVWSGNGPGDDAGIFGQRFATAAPVTISGTVFEDVDFTTTASNYDGGSPDMPLPNVDVELYTDAGVYITSAQTDATGAYTFTGVTSGNYRVRARSATIGDADTLPQGGLNATVPATWPYPLPEMTWGHLSSLVGGQDPSLDDILSGDNAAPGDTYVLVTVGWSDISGVNFGFNYDLIVNVADDANPDDTRSTQGSLRQFIKNSNAIAVVNHSRFLISGP